MEDESGRGANELTSVEDGGVEDDETDGGAK